MIERGVRFVQLYSGDTNGWDAHDNVMKNHTEYCARTDKPVAGLIRDLKQRGLLEDTLVVWTGEFGRTPYSQENQGKDKKPDPMKRGRDHHHTAFSTLLAGGGVKGGLAYGSSDELGMNAVEDKVHVHDLHATILHLLGLDHEKLTYYHNGAQRRLTDVHGHVIQRLLG
jgi:uncharacterized protein (DUF1501 family)